MRIILGLALVIAIAVGAMVLASEKGGEVVIISTTDDRGVPFETSVWIVEYRGSPYLRAGDRESAWVRRLTKTPRIQMQRRGETATYLARPDPANTENVSGIVARDYGWADRLIGLMRDPSKSLAIRLEQVQP